MPETDIGHRLSGDTRVTLPGQPWSGPACGMRSGWSAAWTRLWVTTDRRAFEQVDIVGSRVVAGGAAAVARDTAAAGPPGRIAR